MENQKPLDWNRKGNTVSGGKKSQVTVLIVTDLTILRLLLQAFINDLHTVTKLTDGFGIYTH